MSGYRPFRVGDRVRTGVYVGDEYRPLSDGIVTAVHSGYCAVDVMGFRGGAVWTQLYANNELRFLEEPEAS